MRIQNYFEFNEKSKHIAQLCVLGGKQGGQWVSLRDTKRKVEWYFKKDDF